MSDKLSVLKKVGLDILKFLEAGAPVAAELSGYGSIINPFLAAFLPPTVAVKLPAIERKVVSSTQIVDDAIRAVEGLSAIGNLPAENRLDTASALVTSAFSDAMSLAGHDVVDQALLDKSRQEFNTAVKSLVQARVDFFNSLKPKN